MKENTHAHQSHVDYCFLAHGFGDQQVKPAGFWEAICAEAGLGIVAKASIDFTGWLPCYLLRKRG